MKLKTNKGITLIALVITIIVLLILAAVSIATLTGENGILTKAGTAKIEDAHASVAEGISLEYGIYQIEKQSPKATGEAYGLTFIDFLKGKGYINENNIVITVELLGKELSVGKGLEDKDVYKIEETEEKYILNYYNKEASAEKLWEANKDGETANQDVVLTAPATYAYVIDVGYKDGVVTPDVKAYFVENTEASGEETVYDIMIIGNGEIVGIGRWDAPSGLLGTYYIDSDGSILEKNIDGDIDGYRLKSVKNMKISNGVTNIPYEFCKYGSIERVTIPSSVTSIEWYAFQGCSNLTSITIPSSVTSIGWYTFNGCSNLVSIEIPSSVTSIGLYAFGGCSNLRNVTFLENSNLTKIEKSTFSNCSNLASIEIPSSITSIEDTAFYGCSSLKSIEIPSSVTSIGIRAFSGCSGLKNIKIQKGVTNIGFEAFSGCSSLKSIEIPSSVTSISGLTFSECTNLTSITIKKEEGSITNSPWGATNATVTWAPETSTET